MNYTENHKLCQWDTSDPIRREDFNADNAIIDAALGKIDSALAVQARIYCGTYVGTGTYGSNEPNTLTFSFVPKLVLIQHPSMLYDGERGGRGKLIVCHTLSSSYQQYVTGYSDYVYFKLDGCTLSWYSTNGAEIQCNGASAVYTYFAIG